MCAEPNPGTQKQKSFLLVVLPTVTGDFFLHSRLRECRPWSACPPLEGRDPGNIAAQLSSMRPNRPTRSGVLLALRGSDLQVRQPLGSAGWNHRAGVERVFGDQVEVQRRQIHKRRNVKEYLPENCQKEYDRRMRNAYAMNYAEAKEALQKIFRQLERINPSAARSLEEGLEETLTVHRLGVGAVLRRKLATTNPIESCLSTVQRVARNVKRWREGDQPLRWTATGLLEAEKKFRRIKSYQEILLLKERLNPSRIQQKEVRTVEVA